MPNLSPTMEKVRVVNYTNIFRVILQNGIKRLVTKLSQVTHFVALRQIKLQLILKCKKKVILQRYYTQKVQRMFHSDHQLRFWHTRPKILLLLLIMQQVVFKLQQQSRLKIKLKLVPKLNMLFLNQ